MHKLSTDENAWVVVDRSGFRFLQTIRASRRATIQSFCCIYNPPVAWPTLKKAYDLKIERIKITPTTPRRTS